LRNLVLLGEQGEKAYNGFQDGFTHRGKGLELKDSKGTAVNVIKKGLAAPIPVPYRKGGVSQ
jgi:hypothetical protein